MVTIERHRAAIHRRELSRPLRLAVADGLVTAKTAVFDYGCGHGDDVRLLGAQRIVARGWDPVHRPHEPREPADVVNLGYVLNVIENPEERRETIRTAWALATRVLVVAARTVYDAPLVGGDRFGDGYCTSRSTFQKFFEQDELRSLIDSSTETVALSAAPGVFYVFRDACAREAFAATQCRRAATKLHVSADELFRAHQDVLQPLVDFLNLRGRLPDPCELETLDVLTDRLGSYRRACAIVRQAIGNESWESVEILRAEDLLVYVALSRFQTRPRFSALPRDTQLDVRAFFRNYQRACALADEILMSAGDGPLIARACRASKIGKLTPAALYVHVSALDDVPPLLRVYEGCARGLIGRVDEANIVKLHHDAPVVSYLAYPDFERDPHPALATSLVVQLRDRRVDARDYRASTNPPILHRKELFLGQGSPLRSKFAKLTAQEERAGLFADSNVIGTRDGWAAQLRAHGVRILGHRVVRSSAGQS